MSFSGDKAREHRRALRAFAESEPIHSSEEEEGLDIIRSSRKDLDLSQYIDGQSMSLPAIGIGADPIAVLTQSQSQSSGKRAHHKAGDVANDTSGNDPEITEATAEAPRSRRKTEISLEEDGSHEDTLEQLESEWSEEDTRAGYRDFKNRKTVKRKRVAAETNRIRAERKITKISAAANVVGRKPPSKKRAYSSTGFSYDSVDNAASVAATFLDEPIPEYIVSRKAELNKMREAGLRYPPSYKDIEFLDPVTEEKPKFDRVVKPQREKKDIELRESGGIIPASIAQWLRDYQVEGVEFLHERFVKQTGAILGYALRELR